MIEHPFISLCMIVKDEERWIESCLKSIYTAVDEIIIVDSGSGDRTREICLSFGAEVFDFTWRDSFSEARNYGINKAKGKWILWLDADEEMKLEDREMFLTMLRSYTKDALEVPIVSYYGDFPVNAGRAYTFCSYRLFRNNKGYRFVGDIHEYPDIEGFIPDYDKDMLKLAKIYHYGYLDEVSEAKKKSDRNIKILQKVRAQSVDNPWVDYHMASEYYRAGKYEMAFNHVNMALWGFLNKKQIPPAIAYKLKYDILLISSNYDGAWPGVEKAIELYPDYVDLHFYKGLIFFEKKMYADAIPIFQHCLKLGEQNYKYLTLVGCGSYRAWYYIGMCHEKLGKQEESYEDFKRTISIYKDYNGSKNKFYDEVIKNI